MAKEKTEKSVLKIFFEGLKIYCFNFHKFFLYMAFPVLGQILGLGLVFSLSNWYSANLPDLIMKYPAFDNFATIILGVILLVIPGLLIWAKAFWDYLVAYGALNSMTEAALSIGRVYDFKSHNQTVTRRTFAFISLWFMFGIFTALAVFPLFWVIGIILFIYFILIFQVFTFEEGVSPFGCFQRSLTLIKGKFRQTFFLMFALVVFTMYILPLAFSVIFDFLKLTNILSSAFLGWVNTLPLEIVYETYAKFGLVIGPQEIANSLVAQVIFFIVFGFTLPLRSICWTLWYKYLNNNGEKMVKKTTTRTVKKLDKNILKRAQEKDEEGR